MVDICVFHYTYLDNVKCFQGSKNVNHLPLSNVLIFGFKDNSQFSVEANIWLIIITKLTRIRIMPRCHDLHDLTR